MKETDLLKAYKELEQTVELSNFDPKKVKGNAEGGRKQILYRWYHRR